MLNAHPIPGRFYHIPNKLRHNLMPHVLQEISLDWEHMVQVLKNAITRPPKRGLSKDTVMFGKERVVMWSQAYRSTFLSLLLKYTLFGVKERRITKKEVIYKSKNVTVIHLASLERIQEVFTVSGLCGVSFGKVNGSTMSSCGKINFMVRGRRNIVGYIHEERGDK